MKNRVFLLLFALICINFSKAQYEAVIYDEMQNHFNGGQALPANAPLLITGSVDARAERVEISLFTSKANHNKKPLYPCIWKRLYPSEQNFKLLFSYPLLTNHRYDLVITYFRKTSESEKAELQQLFRQTVATYLNHQIQWTGEKIQLRTRPTTMIKELNELVWQILSHYRTENEMQFLGFSSVVAASLQTLSKYSSSSSDTTWQELRRRFDQQIEAEALDFLSNSLLVQADLKVIRDYPTEKTQASLAVHAGYGGVYISGSIDELAYGHSPYLGFSYTIGNRFFRHHAWRHASLAAGIFTNNFTDPKGEMLTGPLLGRPYYLGAGYSLFRFIRLDAGLVALQAKAPPDGGGDPVAIGTLQLKPFVGLSAEIRMRARVIRK